MLKKWVLFVLVGSILLTGPAAKAQVMGTNLGRHEAEIGFIYKRFHRNFEPAPLNEGKWEVNTFFGRYGAFRWLTGSLEGRVSEYHHEDFEGMSFRRYALGAGATVKVYQRGEWQFAGSFHYNEVWDEDRSVDHFHKRTYGVIAGVQAGREVVIRRQVLNVWAGPMYVRDVGENYPWDSEDPIRSESENNLGVAAGGGVVLFRFLAGSVYAVWADYFQARAAIGVHLGGK